MRGVVVTKAGLEKEKKLKGNSHLANYIFIPFTKGALGYLAFLSVIIVSKYLGFLFGSQKAFNLSMIDFILPALGFTFAFIIKLTEKARPKN